MRPDKASPARADCRGLRETFSINTEYAGIGVDAIAEAAGTNKMTLYRHFGSKDDLIIQCLRDVALEADGMVGAKSNPTIPAIRWRNCMPGFRAAPNAYLATIGAAISPTPPSNWPRPTILRGG